ncbi:MAG: Dabb family protein, partial [Acutalibacteraceae bacterium]
MVKHIVLWKIKDGEDKQQNMTRMAEMLTDLVGKIDGLEGVEMGYNFNTNSDYDIVLYATLRNTASLRYYQNHPLHVACKDFIGTIAVDRTAVDYFYEEGSALTLPSDAVVNDPYMPSQTEQAPFTLPELSNNDEQSHFTEQVQEDTPLLSQEEQPKLNFDTPIATNEKVVFPDLSAAPEQPYHEQTGFNDEPPTLESYNLHNEGNGEPNEQFSYIKNDSTMEQKVASAEVEPVAPPMPFGQNQVYTQSEVPPYGQPVMQNVAFGAPISEPQPMRFADLAPEEPPKSLNFSDIPQEEPKPMRFSDMPQEEPKPMRFSDMPQEEPKPMRFSDMP